MIFKNATNFQLLSKISMNYRLKVNISKQILNLH